MSPGKVARTSPNCTVELKLAGQYRRSHISFGYLQAFEQREQQRVSSDLVDPGRLLADDMAEQSEGRQPAGLFGHTLIHLVQKVL